MSLRDILNFCINKDLITRDEARVIFQLDDVNRWKSKNGYPLLHLICNEVIKEEGDNCDYLKNAQSLIAEVGANPDIFSPHGSSPLHFAAQDGKERLVKMLVRAGANPNLSNQDEDTALEIAVHHSDEAPELIKYLTQKTNRTDKINQAMQEELDDAIENWEDNEARYARKIDLLIDLNLASPSKESLKTHEFASIQAGCWIRIVEDVESEIKILNKRKGKSHEELMTHREMLPNELDNPRSTYTPYSPATFVHSGIPIRLFHSNEAGVLIRPQNRPICYWYDGRMERLTKNFSFANNKKPDNGRYEGQFWDVNEMTIYQTLQVIFKHYFDEQMKGEMDKHGVIRNKRMDEIHLSWNEGFLRYQYEDVIGVLVCPDDKQSTINALKLRVAVNRPLPFYQYKEDGSSKRINSVDLMRKFGLNERGEVAQVHSEHTVQHLRSATTNAFQSVNNNVNANSNAHGAKKLNILE